MRNLKEKFLRIYANLPLGVRKEIILTLDGKPLTWDVAFMEASNQVALSLLKGHNAGESSKRSKKIFGERYRSLISSTADPNQLQGAKFLWWDMMHQVCLGDREKRI